MVQKWGQLANNVFWENVDFLFPPIPIKPLPLAFPFPWECQGTLGNSQYNLISNVKHI